MRTDWCRRRRWWWRWWRWRWRWRRRWWHGTAVSRVGGTQTDDHTAVAEVVAQCSGAVVKGVACACGEPHAARRLGWIENHSAGDHGAVTCVGRQDLQANSGRSAKCIADPQHHASARLGVGTSDGNGSGNNKFFHVHLHKNKNRSEQPEWLAQHRVVMAV